MNRESMLKVVLLLAGLLFSAALYPLIGGLMHPADSDTGDTMMMSLYFALGIFLLIAVRNPSAHRSLIAFAAWSSFAHAVTMSTQGLEMPNQRLGFLIGSAMLVVIGLALLMLTPREADPRRNFTSRRLVPANNILSHCRQQRRKANSGHSKKPQISLGLLILRQHAG